MSEASRRLAGILAADVVGYSAMVGTDEPGTLSRVRELRAAFIQPLAATHSGRLFKTTGDGFFVEFASAVQALRCAIAIQDALRAQPDGLRLRIGVHQGEVVPEGDDLLGDGVIIAARLEPLAEPGGICISARVREDAAGKMALEVEDLGTPELKGIAGKVQVFRVRLGMPERPALPLPDKPSIAVLAFTNMSGDVEQEYFSDGIADDIIAELSRNHSLFVIARNSSFTYKGRAVDIRQVARELGVRYVLEGSVRRSNDRVRVVAQLIDAETGNHVWAERYQRNLADIFAVQDDMVLAITRAIGPAVADAEQRRAMHKRPENLGAWEAYQRGLWHTVRYTIDDVAPARVFFRRALDLDPTLAAAHTGLAILYHNEGGIFATRPLTEVLRLAFEETAKAVALDPNDAEAFGYQAFAIGMSGDCARGLEHVEQALSINPNCVRAHRAKGWLLINLGRPAEARQCFQFAMRIDPRSALDVVPRSHIAQTYYQEGDYPTAATTAQRLVTDRPDHPWPYRWLAAALGQLGRTEEATSVLARATAIAPEAFNFFVRQRVPWMRQEDYEHMLDGLRKAGWQG